MLKEFQIICAIEDIVATGDIIKFRSPAGTLKQIDLWTNTANTNGDNVFNLNINGSDLFAGGARPKIAQSQSHGQLTGLSNGLTFGQEIILQLESMATGGVKADLVLQLTIDDGVEIPVKEISQNSQSTAYTLVLSDSGKQILHPSTDNNARTFTIPANSSVAYPVGTAITFINKINTVTIAINTDTLTLASAGTTGSRTLAANGIATAIKISSTEWIISGVGLT